MSKESLYKETIALLPCLELVVKDKEEYKILRKKILDLANDIKRVDLDGN